MKRHNLINCYMKNWISLLLAMALICLPAAAGGLLPLGRSAMLLTPLMLAPVLLLALLTAKDLDLSLLLPLRGAEPLSVGAAALETANLLSLAFFFGFFGDRLSGRVRARDLRPWLLALLGVVALMTVESLGMFGPELTAGMRYPYFMLVRDLTLLGALERAEPVVIALWFFSDFILISLLLHLAAGNLRFALRLRSGRVLAPLCALAAAAAALALPGGMESQRVLSERIVPFLSAAFAFAPVPLLLAVGKLRKKL